MKFKYLLLAIFLALGGLLVVFSVIPSPTTESTELPRVLTLGQNIEVGACITKNIGKPTQEFYGCHHNTLFYSGMNMTRDLLIYGTGGKVLNITLCNATTVSVSCEIPTAAGTEVFSPWVDSGLVAVEGTASLLGGNGNVSIEHTFTSSGSGTKLINVTRLGNGTDYFAGISFTTVSLDAASGDTININITLYASES